MLRIMLLTLDNLNLRATKPRIAKAREAVSGNNVEPLVIDWCGVCIIEASFIGCSSSRGKVWD